MVGYELHPVHVWLVPIRWMDWEYRPNFDNGKARHGSAAIEYETICFDIYVANVVAKFGVPHHSPMLGAVHPSTELGAASLQ